jgi:hydroxylaminobenzene mutase
MVQVPVPHLALAAHLNALFGGFWLISLGATFEFLRYSDSQKRRLAYLVAIPSWGNWAITLLASVLGVKGLGFNSDPANNFVAVLLQVVVVIPSLIAGVYWVRGFFVSPRTAHI